MAITQNTFTGNGSNLGPFSFTFQWLESTDIKVTVAGVLKTAGTHYNLQSLNYATKTGGQVLFTAGNAPANGAAIVIYRQTDDTDLVSTFYSGSAIRAQDLNNNFTQGLYVTQEANNNVVTSNATANTALTTANTALSNSTTAVSTANTASSNASAAVATANTANTNASAAVSTANTASSNASAAVSTANTASSNASTALSTANTALSTANTASTNASAAVTTANTASTNASNAVSTANTASTNASAAVSTANTASSNASTAVSTANTALSTANAAASAVANAILYDIIANVAAIPASPANNDAVEVTNSTGIESFTPLIGKPVGFVGNSGLSVRMVYTTTGNTWTWTQYFPNDPETRYLKLGGGTLTGAVGVTAGTAAAPSVFISGDTNTGIYSPGADQLAISTSGAQRLVVDASGRVGIGTSTPSEGFQVVSATGYSIFNDIRIGSDGNNDIYKGSGALTISTTDALLFKTGALSERLRITSAGLVGVGTSSPAKSFVISSGGAAGMEVGVASGSAAGGTFIEHYNRSSSTYVQCRTIASDFLFQVSGTDALAINSSGRLGVGTTSPQSLLHLETDGTALRIVRGSAIGFAYHTGTAATDAFRIQSNGGSVDLHSAASQPITFSAGTTEKARIDSSGRLLVGTSTDLSGGETNRVIQGAAPTGAFIALSRTDATITNNEVLAGVEFRGNGNPSASIYAWADNDHGSGDYPSRLVFSVSRDGSASPTEALRISNSGQATLFAGSSQDVLRVKTQSGAGTALALFVGAHSATGVTDGTGSIIIWSNGNVVNTNNSYGAISDLKLKENIVDAGSQWSDIKALQVRKYNFKEGQTHTQIGLVAQEVELVSPGLVTESPDRDAEGNDLGTVTKSVNYSVLYMKAVKALQEAMERIETLEASNADLLARVSALESA